MRRHRQWRAALAGWVCALLSTQAPAQTAGDPLRGAQAYESRCAGCHSVESDRVGPRHRGVLGRRAGSVAGFGYSRALKASGLLWDARLLERWLADPQALVPGQAMGYSVADPAVRTDLVAFLATLKVAN